jgi:hypothetical protein
MGVQKIEKRTWDRVIDKCVAVATQTNGKSGDAWKRQERYPPPNHLIYRLRCGSATGEAQVLDATIQRNKALQGRMGAIFPWATPIPPCFRVTGQKSKENTGIGAHTHWYLPSRFVLTLSE